MTTTTDATTGFNPTSNEHPSTMTTTIDATTRLDATTNEHPATMSVLGYASPGVKAPLGPFRFDRRESRPDDVVIDILYCGICHSDVHHVRGDWGTDTYPMVPGHEIVGRVTSVGKDVTRFKVGEHAGVGCLVDSCGHCAACKRGMEQSCERGATLTYNDVDRHDGMRMFGGYSERIVVTEKFALKIPDGIDLAGAAPLLCAGITTWSPLRHWHAGEGSNVAVVGLGGLGHMALKFARALGSHVTLLTHSPGKEDDARRLGAHDVVLTGDAKQMAALAGRFDLIIDTVPYVHDLNPYVNSLALDGTLVIVGFLGKTEPPLNTAPLVMGRKSVAGSNIGGLAETQEMLDFCAAHGIASDVEVIPMRGVNDAYERMLKSDVKYRFVIDLATLDDDA